jgi:predicted CXXCH cytochrome family protein
VSLFVVLGLGLSETSLVSGEERVEHPFLEQKDIKPETCLTCHPEKKEGRFVHTAVGMGCENCHIVTSENNKTTITPVAMGGRLCAMCHEARKGPIFHGPYRDGQCLTCHDPHAAAFKAQTRAPGNALCLECHAPRHTSNSTVALFGVRTVSVSEFEAIPKIKLDPSQCFGHPWVGHPVAEMPDPLRPGEKMSCLSCHQAHAASLPKLILAAKPGRNICDLCHQARQQ